jgi:hypothetical protein
MDAEEYRRQYEQQLEAAGRRRSAPVGPDTSSMGARELVAAMRDQAGDPAVRIAVIDAASVGAASRPSIMRALLALLEDPGEVEAVRSAALHAIAQNSFSRAAFRRWEPDVRAVLRAVATGDDPALRDEALERLALDGDEYAQRLLVDGLRDPSLALVPPARALQLLGHDVHAEHYPLLRDLVETTRTKAVRRTALRLLAADSDATELFARIAADRDEDPVARSTSAVALQSLAPARFDDVARDVVGDDADDRRVRATFTNAITNREP